MCNTCSFSILTLNQFVYYTMYIALSCTRHNLYHLSIQVNVTSLKSDTLLYHHEMNISPINDQTEYTINDTILNHTISTIPF